MRSTRGVSIRALARTPRPAVGARWRYSTNGDSSPYHPDTDEGYPVSSIDVELAPGESTVLHFGWLGAEPFDGELFVQSTPLISLPETTVLKVEC